MNDNGERWEGDSFRGEPFGYGCFYDENNKLIYCGYVFQGKKVCYGEEYYPESNTIEYCGNFVNGLRHGRGCTYDKEGNMLYEGYWVFGRNDNFDLIIDNNCEDDNIIHNLVRELTIGSNCFNKMKELKIVEYVNLKSIEIGNNSFRNVRVFEIGNCNELEQLIIGEECFSKDLDRFTKPQKADGQLVIHDCSKLSLIRIGDHSFCDYCTCFQLYGIIT